MWITIFVVFTALIAAVIASLVVAPAQGDRNRPDNDWP